MRFFKNNGFLIGMVLHGITTVSLFSIIILSFLFLLIGCAPEQTIQHKNATKTYFEEARERYEQRNGSCSERMECYPYPFLPSYEPVGGRTGYTTYTECVNGRCIRDIAEYCSKLAKESFGFEVVECSGGIDQNICKCTEIKIISPEVTSSHALKCGASNGMELRSYFPYVVPASTIKLATEEICCGGSMSTGVEIPASPAVSFK